MDAEDYPTTALEFQARFATEAACQAYLMQVRWPEGFVCPKCSGGKSWVNGRHLAVCAACGHQTSLTAGTVLHRTRKPLRMWFEAMGRVCTPRTGGSAKGLQRLLELGTYRTAWTWLHKLRRAMVRAGRESLQGAVEVDDGYVGGEEAGVRGRKTLKKAHILAAIEVPDASRRVAGRVRIGVVEDFTAASCLKFVQENVLGGSRVITDEWQGFASLSRRGYAHEVRRADEDPLQHVHWQISLLKRRLLGTHHGGVRPWHLPEYLEEYCFRHNRRKSTHVGKLFYRMLQGASVTAPATYRDIVGEPDSPRPTTGRST